MADGGFEVVLSDLESAAGTFGAEAAALQGLIPASGPACPDGGDGDIDAAMHAVLSMIGTLNQSLAGAMAAHGQKLGQAHTNYARTELGLSQLSRDLLDALTTGVGQTETMTGRP